MRRIIYICAYICAAEEADQMRRSVENRALRAVTQEVAAIA